MADKWIPISEAIRLSGYHGDHIRLQIRAGRIKAQKFGETWQISRKSLIDYLGKQSDRGGRRGPKPVKRKQP